jgi:ArsR family transcriptional regulator, arsenate/arsenite/antimonite-responsive transcriptional repressor
MRQRTSSRHVSDAGQSARQGAGRTVRRERVDVMFRAFSDRTRLRVLELLRQGELCVGDLVQILRVPQPTASRHLSYLRRAGLVVARKHGLWMFYALAPARNAFHRKLLDCLVACFHDVPEIATDAARARKLRKSGGCCPDTIPAGGTQ